MRSRLAAASLALLALLAPGAGTAAAQGTGEGADGSAVREVIYTREVFRYDASRRPDPFRSLLGTAEMGVRPDDLTLVGVIYSTDPRASVAVFIQRGATRRVRARVGDRIGGMTVAAIYPRRVEVVVDELGMVRRETLQLRPVRTRASEGEEDTDEEGSPEQ